MSTRARKIVTISIAAVALLAPAAAEAQGPIVSRSGDLTVRPSGFPTSPEPARQLASGSVDYGLKSGKIRATVTLNAEATAATDADLAIFLGRLSGTNCNLDEIAAATPTFGNLAANWTRSGAGFTLEKFLSVGDKDCAVATVSDPADPSTDFDALIGTLRPTYGASQLSVDSVEFLGKNQSKLKLVPGSWTRLDVTISNADSATADASAVVIGGDGKGLRVKGEPLGTTAQFPLEPGDASTGDLMVKLASQGKGKGGSRRAKKPKLEVTATPAEGAPATRTLRVQAVKPPPRPVDGDYEGDSSSVEFSIENGKVVGWQTTAQTTCGGFPALPTTTFNNYDFPAVKIPRNGIVDAEDERARKDDLYGASLVLKVAGDRVTNGEFDYSGPNRCTASVDFVAKRSKGG